jgi:hypothetical protein
MLSAVVQLIRNFMCCIKDLELYRDTWLWDSSIIQQFHKFPEPLNETTPLEAMISVVQAFVVVTGVPAALGLFGSSRRKLQRIYRLIAASKSSLTDVDRLVNASLVKEAYWALRNMFVAFNLFFISLAFVWLSANSWHITSAGWIGGLPALIHALTVMNVCLFPLLYFMYKDARENLAKAARMQLFADKLQAGNATEADVGWTVLCALSEWSPFWNETIGFFESIDTEMELARFAKEKTIVQALLENITGSIVAQKKTDTETDESIFRTQAQRANAEKLLPLISVARVEGYREYLYLVMNTIAWYGYSACVIVYYWPDELKQPDWLRIMLLHFSNDDADWRGNFAGDLMWATEPIVILFSPWYLNAIKRRKPTKAKND